RDLSTRAGGEDVIAEASVDADVSAGFGRERRIVRLATAPSPAEVAELVGAPVGSGFRAALSRAMPDASGTTLGLLLDDLPVAALISGYAGVRSAALSGEPFVVPDVVERMADLCSGWRNDGVAITAIRGGLGMPFQDCPPAPSLDGDDPSAWHDQPPLATGAMRRRRRVDVWSSTDGWTVDAMFRDTYGEPDGHEGVLHEYTLSATVDPGLALVSIEATPRVLPFPECPWAAANVARLIGLPVDSLRQAVPDVLAGKAGCTHLNDLLRALSDVAWLVGMLG
ncbi:MAG TPA: DUF2889 domain-containing protein, partial [Acidimicrobiales bacterium]|nr:DUF2889 domain-containing protein [Acidimicrobiales bacterium]